MRAPVPTKLVEMTKARRVIPFIGAGFSASLNLPDWDSLLLKLAKDIDSPIPHETVKELCNNDPLQIAEYYLLISDGRVGPLRHAISTALQTTLDPLTSGMHVELVNLGCPLIYTTNFDDLIEQTFRALKQPLEVISLPKHLATPSDAKPQVIKYHGDLRHEQTLVLTESSYYARLDLESPMDIKFRSDLLGRSVLFMGYSFRDINIRIIWFRLMRMMKDIRQEDRPTSFIVTFTPNAVLEKLYQAVGIETICLDPTAKSPTSQSERTRLMNDFLLTLASAAAPDAHIPGQPDQPLFYSEAITQSVADLVEQEELSFDYGETQQASPISSLLAQAGKRTISPAHKEAVRSVLSLKRAAQAFPADSGTTLLAVNYARQFGQDPAVTQICVRALTRHSTRDILFQSKPNWKIIWGAKIHKEFVTTFLSMFELEFRYHEEPDSRPDPDIAYILDIAKRIRKGEISGALPEPDATKLQALIERVAKLYPKSARYEPKAGAPPLVEDIVSQIEEPGPDGGEDPHS